MSKIHKDFENTAELYRIELCKMWEIRYSDTYWIADEVGGVLDVQGGFLDLGYDDVRYIVDNRINMQETEKWQEYNSDVEYIKLHLSHINLKSWVAGCPRVNIVAWNKELMHMMMGKGKGYKIPIEDE